MAVALLYIYLRSVSMDESGFYLYESVTARR